MRIFAGVLIILMAVINLGAGVFYGVGGGAFGVAGMGMAAQQAVGQQPATERDRAMSMHNSGRDSRPDASRMQALGGILLIAGISLFVLSGLEIAAGVLLFLVKHPLFIAATGLLQLLASGASIAAYNQPGVASGLGIVIGVLVLIAAQSVRRDPGHGF